MPSQLLLPCLLAQKRVRNRPPESWGVTGFPISQRTVRIADPLIPPDFAAIVAVPALSAVASPLPLIDATGFGDDDQVTALVRSFVLPLL